MPSPAVAQEYKGKRVDVEDHQVPWKYPWPDYAPRSFNHPSVLANGRDMPDGQKWADPADPSLLREELEARITYLGTSGSGDGGGGTSGGGSGDGGPSATPVSRASSGVSRGGSGVSSGGSGRMTIRRGSSMTCPFAPGDLVRHKERGVGSVCEFLSDGRMPVQFENGETHRYKPSSWQKFELVEKVAEADDGGGDSPRSPRQAPFAPGDLVRHKERGIGSVSEFLSDGRMPVLFENGETHRYKPSSWYKFELVEKANQGSEEEKASVVFGGGMPLAQVEP